MKICAFGDIHMEYGAAAAVAGISQADLVIITGDLTNFGHRRDAQQVLDNIGVEKERLLALHGNLDHPDVAQLLEEFGIDLHGKGIIRGEVGIFGVGGSNITPFNTPSEYSEEEIARILEQGYAQVEAAPIKIMVSHTPPVDTACDRISSGAHVGSEAVRRFIEEKRPALCLTGHIHEAKAVDRIGDTLVINPGMVKDGGWILCQPKDGGWTGELMG